MPFKQAHLHFKRRAPQAVEPRLPYRLHLIILRRFGKGLHLRLHIALGVPRVDAHSVALPGMGAKSVGDTLISASVARRWWVWKSSIMALGRNRFPPKGGNGLCVSRQAKSL